MSAERDMEAELKSAQTEALMWRLEAEFLMDILKSCIVVRLRYNWSQPR